MAILVRSLLFFFYHDVDAYELLSFRLYWIDPLAYAYKALLINEMQGQMYSCDGVGNAIPQGPGYDDWAHKVSQ